MSAIDVVILTYNRFNYLQKTIQSLVERTKYPYRLIVIDNNSNDKRVKKYLYQRKKEGTISELIVNSENLILKGWMKGINRVKSEYFAITDPDIIVPQLKPCWLTQLVNMMKSFPKLARIGLSLDPCDVPSCWTKKQAKRLAFRTGPFFNRDYALKIKDIDTTMQLIRTKCFKKMSASEKTEINADFWKKFHNFGLSVAAQNIIARHLGWNEYKDYPEYLMEKTINIRYYKEKELVTG